MKMFTAAPMIRTAPPLMLALLLSLSMLFLTPGTAVAQETTQPILRSNVLELSLGGRVQTQLNTTSVDGRAPSQLLIRRARIELAVRVNDWLTAELAPDFAGGEVELKDAYLQVEFTPGFSVLAGQAHRPFGLLEQTSSKRMPVVERGLRIRGLPAADEYALVSGLDYSDRDIGIQVLGELPWSAGGESRGVTYAAGVFRGPLHGQVGDQDSYQFAARVTASPVADLTLGAGWSSRDFSDGGLAPALERGHAFEVDLEYGSFDPGLHILAELARGDLNPFTDATFWGAQTWIAYRTEPLHPKVHALEPVVRVSHSAPDVPGVSTLPGGTLITPGINLYLTPLTRLMLNYDIWRSDEGWGDASSFKAMLQLAF